MTTGAGAAINWGCCGQAQLTWRFEGMQPTLYCQSCGSDWSPVVGGRAGGIGGVGAGVGVGVDVDVCPNPTVHQYPERTVIMGWTGWGCCVKPELTWQSRSGDSVIECGACQAKWNVEPECPDPDAHDEDIVNGTIADAIDEARKGWEAAQENVSQCPQPDDHDNERFAQRVEARIQERLQQPGAADELLGMSLAANFDRYHYYQQAWGRLQAALDDRKQWSPARLRELMVECLTNPAGESGESVESGEASDSDSGTEGDSND